MHLAELNIARLIAPKDDPRVKEFMDNIDRINGMAKRMPGFVWIMEGEDGAGNTENSIGSDPQLIPNLTVWENVETLEKFVWNTVHKQFFDRRQEWFEILGDMHFVMWWVPEGHQPTLDEAIERLEDLRTNGPSDRAFGWAELPDAQLWKQYGRSVK